jgi:hypothetical protein
MVQLYIVHLGQSSQVTSRLPEVSIPDLTTIGCDF